MLRKPIFAGLLMLITGYAQAECYNDGNKQAPPLTADLSETFTVRQKPPSILIPATAGIQL